MKGITFGNYHSFDDLSLLLTSKEIGSPIVKTKEIDIPGGDGTLDLTDFFGEERFENVTHRFQFSTIVPQSSFLSVFSNVKNKIHGKKLRVILDDDPYFYYVGRCFVSSFTDEKKVGKIDVECVCEPWKYKKNETVAENVISGSGTVTLTNGRKRTVPTIKTTAPFTIAFLDNTFSVNAGTTIIPEIELSEGDNTVTVTGTGTITFTYQEGDL